MVCVRAVVVAFFFAKNRVMLERFAVWTFQTCAKDPSLVYAVKLVVVIH